MRRRQPPEHAVKRDADREQATIAACRAVELKANRQFARRAERDRNLDTGMPALLPGSVFHVNRGRAFLPAMP
ncbi:hypothetical protein ACVIW3_002931 [Bradyrhizobium diazoefficiens]|nr:hypothetical protein AAV28_35640 [Bradyrhizobium diazoefficiens USDA 110]